MRELSEKEKKILFSVYFIVVGLFFLILVFAEFYQKAELNEKELEEYKKSTLKA